MTASKGRHSPPSIVSVRRLLPTVREPLPRELKDLMVQLVAFEMRKRGSSARPPEALQFVRAQLASSTGPSIRR